MFWFLRRGLFRPFGPVGLAFTAFRIWRRLPAERKDAIKARARTLALNAHRTANTLRTRRPHGQES
jgi:hypothetical protein